MYIYNLDFDKSCIAIHIFLQISFEALASPSTSSIESVVTVVLFLCLYTSSHKSLLQFSNNARILLATTTQDGITGENEIAEMWQDH